jgi:molybdopterin/thiamine biosynthesis adenylyltransferase
MVNPPVPVGDGKIRIGSGFGMASELTDDAAGHTWQLLRLLDGSRDLAQLVQELRRADPQVQAEQVHAAVQALAEAGLLEDAAIRPPSEFTADEVERYRRNVEFFSHVHQPPLHGYDFQQRLRAARVTVLGLGGLGSYVALILASIGVGDLLLVDFDTVEKSNLNRQVLYRDADLGRAKVEAAAERLATVNPHVRVATRNERVDGTDAVRAVMTGRDLLVCAADRPRVRIYDWINEAALADGVPWIRGANDGLTVNVFLHVPHLTACFECGQLTGHEQAPWYRNYLRYLMAEIGDRTINPCIAPAAGLVGSLAALEAVKQLTGLLPPPTRGRKLVFDLGTLEVDFVDVPRRADCPKCGTAAPGAPGEQAAVAASAAPAAPAARVAQVAPAAPAAPAARGAPGATAAAPAAGSSGGWLAGSGGWLAGSGG